MFAVKICGITSLADALVVAEAGGAAVGFNFYRKSARYLSPEAAHAIAGRLPSTIWRVGVFVNESTSVIGDVSRQVGLDCVQLHGDESAELLTALPSSLSVIRAVRSSGDLAAAADFLLACERVGRLPDAVLVDAHVPGAYGGTGQTVDWQALAADTTVLGRVPLILAGGLTPDNVRTAIETVRPSGVDTASGVETAPGVKDHDRTRQFIREATDALLVGARTNLP